MDRTETLILMALQLFAGSNPTVQVIEQVLPQFLQAIQSAKAGQAFAVSVPGKLDQVPGTFSFGFSPSA